MEDSGIGLPATEVERIFDAFSQIKDGFSRRFSGTGLGLTISRQISRAMGVDLACVSVPGTGSTFTFTLPWRPTAPAGHRQPDTLDAPLILDSHVLLVDDKPVNLLVAWAMLDKFGIRTVVATNGEEAVAAYPLARPAIVLMDCHMPLLRRLRRHRPHPGTRSPGRHRPHAERGRHRQCLR